MSHMLPPRKPTGELLAAIDVGSNSLRMEIAQPLPTGQFRLLAEHRTSTRLASRLASTGRLDRVAIARTITALAGFQKILSQFEPVRLRTIATCAVREAENGGQFCQQVAAELGMQIEVISGEQEGRYALASVQHAFDVSAQHIAVADVGGGSTEVLLSDGGRIQEIYCTDLGAVRLSELFGPLRATPGEDFAALVGRIDRCLEETIRDPPLVPQTLYGTGGTFTTLASMLAVARREDIHMLLGYPVSHADVRDWLHRLRPLDHNQRRAVPGLRDDRSDLIVAGLAIVDRLMVHLRLRTLRVHTGGVRDGLLWTMMSGED